MIAYRTIGCHQDTHRALQVQIHEMTLRVGWIEQIWTLKMRVSLCSNLPEEDHYHLKVPSRLVPPWEGWKPDSNFLHELHKWNIANKDRKLPAVLAKVNSILESKPVQAALEFIPSSPFPARPLVKTIVSLIQLGIVSDISSQTPCHLPILIYRPPRKFLRQGMTSMILRIRWLLISPTWP